MKKTTLVLFLILCLYSATILRNNKTIVNATSSTLIVGDDGFRSIQEAINNASSGDTIFVHRGTYIENITINKSIMLIGEDRESTIIDGNFMGNVVTVKAPNVTISGFTIKNSDPSGYGIIVERFRNIVIHNNKIRDNYGGIQIMFSGENKIYENIISANYIGIQLFYSSSNAIYRNNISSNTVVGIDIYYYSINNLFYENSICGNYWGVYFSLYSHNNVFYHNNFVNNLYHVYAKNTTNIWSLNGEGNYWDNYKGGDINKDGIGDVPYSIDERNKDYYPLMGMFYIFAAPFKGDIYHIAMISNSTILNFTFKVVAESRTKVILFNATTASGCAGFSRVVVPKALMESIHAVLVNDEEVNAILLNTANEKNIIYIEYPGNCSIKIVYSELLVLYYQLLANYSELYDKLQGDYDALQNELKNLNQTLATLNEIAQKYLNASLYYQNQAQNFKGLTYIFTATTAIFLAMTIYLSKVAHKKQRSITES